MRETNDRKLIIVERTRTKSRRARIPTEYSVRCKVWQTDSEELPRKIDVSLNALRWTRLYRSGRGPCRYLVLLWTQCVIYAKSIECACLRPVHLWISVLNTLRHEGLPFEKFYSPVVCLKQKTSASTSNFHVCHVSTAPFSNGIPNFHHAFYR